MRYKAFSNELHPSVPYVFLYNTGTQEFTTAGVLHTWTTVKCITSHFSHDTNAILLNTNSSGLFKVTFECSLNGNAESVLLKNDVVLPGCVCRGVDGHSITAVVALEKDDILQVKTTGIDGTRTSIANSTRLIVEFIPMKGYNNDSGGRTEYKGGVLR